MRREEMCRSLYLSEACVVAVSTGRSWSKHVLVRAGPCILKKRASLWAATSYEEARKGNKKRAKGRVAWPVKREDRTRPLGG